MRLSCYPLLCSLVQEVKNAGKYSQGDCSLLLNSYISQQESLLPVQQDSLSACWCLSVNHRRRGLYSGSSLPLAGQAAFRYSWQRLGHEPTWMLTLVAMDRLPQWIPFLLLCPSVMTYYVRA